MRDEDAIEKHIEMCLRRIAEQEEQIGLLKSGGVRFFRGNVDATEDAIKLAELVIERLQAAISVYERR